MARMAVLGELEQLVLLAALRLGKGAYAPAIARILEEKADREMSRGTLYATLDRLEEKGFLEWEVEASTSRRSGNRKRRFQVTKTGIQALAESRNTLIELWGGMEHILSETGA